MKMKLLLVGSAVAMLSACKSTGVNPEIEQALEPTSTAPTAPISALPIPDAVTQDLMPKMSTFTPAASQLNEQRFDINAHQVPAEAFFQSLVVDTPFSVAVHPDVSGEISLTLKAVTLAEVVEVVSSLYGYEIQVKQKMIQIFPAGLRTETFSVDYLSMQRMGLSSTSISSGGISDRQNDQNSTSNSNYNQGLGLAGASSDGRDSGSLPLTMGSYKGTTILTQNQNNFWQDLEKALGNLVADQPDRRIIVNAQAGLVTVKASPDELRSIGKFLEQTEQHLQRQVILEAKVIEVSLLDDFQQGINWQSLITQSGSTTLNLSTQAGTFANVITSSIGGNAQLTFTNPDFSGVISLLKTQGDVQVLSSPRITASNNQKAVIKVGTDEYFVTEVSTTTVTGTATTSTPNIELEPFFSGIALDVTPQIDANGEVILHVHPSVIDTIEQTKIITLNQQGYELPLAQSTVRESDTVIRARSGEIVIIGGLMQSQTQDRTSKVPLLGDIPVLGEMFTSRGEKVLKKELVIMIKPTVVGQGTWSEQLQRSSNLLKSWYGN